MWRTAIEMLAASISDTIGRLQRPWFVEKRIGDWWTLVLSYDYAQIEAQIGTCLTR